MFGCLDLTLVWYSFRYLCLLRFLAVGAEMGVGLAGADVSAYPNNGGLEAGKGCCAGWMVFTTLAGASCLTDAEKALAVDGCWRCHWRYRGSLGPPRPPCFGAGLDATVGRLLLLLVALVLTGGN